MQAALENATRQATMAAGATGFAVHEHKTVFVDVPLFFQAIVLKARLCSVPLRRARGLRGVARPLWAPSWVSERVSHRILCGCGWGPRRGCRACASPCRQTRRGRQCPPR
jgi:hypothetical protein